MPVTIAVFVNPGTIPATKPGATDRSNRSFEYDSLGDRYAHFLIDEFLPVALKGLNVSDRSGRSGSVRDLVGRHLCVHRRLGKAEISSARCSATSAASPTFAAAGLIRDWFARPKRVPNRSRSICKKAKTISTICTATGLWGTRTSPPPCSSPATLTSLVMTEGGHSGKWGGVEFPDALRWLWSDDSASTELVSTQTKPQWQPHPDAVPSDDVPHGTVERMPPWESKIFPNTIRDWAIYVPAQYRQGRAGCIDGFSGRRAVAGTWRVAGEFRWSLTT